MPKPLKNKKQRVAFIVIEAILHNTKIYQEQLVQGYYCVTYAQKNAKKLREGFKGSMKS
jgi:hypothetical protein